MQASVSSRVVATMASLSESPDLKRKLKANFSLHLHENDHKRLICDVITTHDLNYEPYQTGIGSASLQTAAQLPLSLEMCGMKVLFRLDLTLEDAVHAVAEIFAHVRCYRNILLIKNMKVSSF